MSNTYTQIHIQCVFAPKYREALIDVSWKNELSKYITTIIQNIGHKMIAINSMPDHLHMFFGMRPHQSLSDLMQVVKADSSKWINNKGFTRKKFNWQDGYGGFSYEKRRIPQIANYIHNQEEHHRKKTFLEEYHELLEEFGIEYDERYLFKEPM
jgi:REP element-mobilizing transposase RayT